MSKKGAGDWARDRAARASAKMGTIMPATDSPRRKLAKLGRLTALLILWLGFSAPMPAQAQDIAPLSAPTAFVLESALLLCGAFSALLLVVAFCLRDIGIIRVQNKSVICTRYVALFAIGVVCSWAVGFELARSVEPGGLLGDFDVWPQSKGASALGHIGQADWLLHIGLALTALCVISSAAAGRVRVWSFLGFAVGFVSIVFPIISGWVWHEGYLAKNWGVC